MCKRSYVHRRPSKTAKNFSVQLKVWTTLCRATNKPEGSPWPSPAEDTAQHTLQWDVTNVTCSSCFAAASFAAASSAEGLGLSKFVRFSKRNQYRNCNFNRNSYLNKAETGNGNVHYTWATGQRNGLQLGSLRR